MKKIFVMDFDGTISTNEPILEATTEEAVQKMQGLNLKNLGKVMAYLSNQEHYVILGSLKSLWNKHYEDMYFNLHGRRNTSDAYNPVTFTQFRNRMHAFLDHHYGEDRPFLLNSDLNAYENFEWDKDLILKDKNLLLDCARDFVAKLDGFDAFKFGEGKKEEDINIHVILVDDDLRYQERLERGYGFIHADLSDNDPKFNNSYLVKMLTYSIESSYDIQAPSTSQMFNPETDIKDLENAALKKLSEIECVDDTFMANYILPLKRAYNKMEFKISARQQPHP